MADLKESSQAVAGEVLTSLSGFAPSMLLTLGMRVAVRVPQRSLHTVTTNVPGPQVPLYRCGQQMLEAFPFVPLIPTTRVAVAIFSYDGALGFGITGDFDAAPDLDVMARDRGRRRTAPRDVRGRRRRPEGARSARVPKADYVGIDGKAEVASRGRHQRSHRVRRIRRAAGQEATPKGPPQRQAQVARGLDGAGTA